MLDSEVIKIFAPIIEQGLINQGVAFTVDVLRAYQPVNVGVSLNSAVYFYKLRDEFLGRPKDDASYNILSGDIRINYKQYVQSIYQIQIFHKPDIFDEDALTANDLARIVRNSLQRSSAVYNMNSSGVAVSRIGEIKNAPYRDDKNQFNIGPLFEIILTHADEINSTGDFINEQEISIFKI